MSILRILFPTLIILAAILGCARQTVPTGGPKDTIPPVMQLSTPPNNSINFKGDKVQLQFDEHIILDNPKEQILITPNVGKDYEIVAKKKTVTLTFNQPLQDSTTYSINFRDGIKDITEKNPPRNLKLAFSTGTYIDSLIIRGSIKDPLNDKEIKNATVALYQSDTFNIFAHKPSYITKTNDKGFFSIENLKPGNYYLYAFNDANRNLIVDSKTEGYAFSTDTIQLKRNLTIPTLNYFRLDSRPIKLTSARPYNTYYNIKLSKTFRTYKITTEENDSISSILAEDNSSIKVYRTFTQDSLQVRLQATDSLNQIVDTTLFVKFSPRKVTPEPFQVTPSDWRLFADRAQIQGTLQFNKPIQQINYDSIFFQVDSLTRIPLTQADIHINTITRKITITKDVDKKLFRTSTEQPTQQRPTPGKAKPTAQNNVMHIRESAFISVESDSSKAIQEQLRVYTSEETGIIQVNIQTVEPYYVVQLLDPSFKIIRSARNQSSIKFAELLPGDYQLRMVIDYNNDGSWTPGDITKRIPTEPIKFYQTEKKSPIINLKANWEIGPLLISF